MRRCLSMLVGSSVALLGSALIAGAATIYVEPNGSDSDSGLTWDLAKKTIQAGIDAAVAGGHTNVVVSNGTYAVSASITISNALRVESYDPDVSRTIVSWAGGPIFVVSHPSAVLQRFTIVNAVNVNGGGITISDGVVRDCVISNCTWATHYGAGIWMTGGTVTNCLITDNEGSYYGGATGGGGVYITGGVMTRSTIRRNSSRIYPGGGVYMVGGRVEACTIQDNTGVNGGGIYVAGGVVRNCVFLGNRSYAAGGGLYLNSGSAENCTFVRNTSTGEGGGVYLAANGALTNSIAVENYGNSVAARDVQNAGGQVVACCTIPLLSGAGNISADPQFADLAGGDYRLLPGSPCLNAGTNLAWMPNASDRDGNPRLTGTVDMGAYEAAAASEGPFRIGFQADRTRGESSIDAVFAASVAGTNTGDLTYWWNFGNGTSTNGNGLSTVTNTYAPGIFTVRLTVSNTFNEGATLSKADYILVGPLSLYVSTNGAAIAPYTNWATASRDINWAFDKAGSNDTIYLAGGTYGLTRTLLMGGREATVRGSFEGTGTAGPGNQDIDRWPTEVTRSSSVTSLRLLAIDGATNSRLERILFSGGLSLDSGGQVPGTGVTILNSEGIRISGCRLRKNNSTDYGGGLYAVNSSGVISNCDIFANSVHARTWDAWIYGGGVYLSGGAWTFCDTALGANNTDRERMREYFDNNRERLLGGGIYVASGSHLVRNCAIYGNNGSRPFNSTTAEHVRQGGGLYVNGGSVRVLNSTIVGNNNEGVRLAGGSLALTNCILWGNGDDITGAVTLAYCDIGDGDSGPGCISADPRFERGLYLGAGSPCTNAGGADASVFGLDTYTTATNGVVDTGAVDLGYHYANGLQPSFADLYAATNGNDANSGASAAEAFRTLTKALYVAKDGTHVHLGSGTFDRNGGEVFPVGMRRPGLHVAGAGSSLTTLDATGANDQVVTIAGIPVDGRLEDLRVTGGNPIATYGGGVGIWQAAITLDSCHVVGNVLRSAGDVDTEFGGGIGSCLAAVTMVDCTVQSNQVVVTAWDQRAYGGGIGIKEGCWRTSDSVISYNGANGDLRSLNYGGGMYVDGGTHRFNNLLIHHNVCNTNGSQVIAMHEGDGAYILSTTNVVFQDCTFVDNFEQGLESVSNVVANSCILWSNKGDVTGLVSLAYCDIGAPAASVATSDCTSVDPLFVDRIYYHLQSRMAAYEGGYFSGGDWKASVSNSPLIDMGDPTAPYDSEPQPNGRRVNMGAYANSPVASLSWERTGAILVVH